MPEDRVSKAFEGQQQVGFLGLREDAGMSSWREWSVLPQVSITAGGPVGGGLLSGHWAHSSHCSGQ